MGKTLWYNKERRLHKTLGRHLYFRSIYLISHYATLRNPHIIWASKKTRLTDV